MFGGGPAAPKPTPMAAAPKEEDKAVQQAASDAARRRKLGRGFRSTILGGALTSDQAPAAAGLKSTFGA